jgi:hypothetical protein
LEVLTPYGKFEHLIIFFDQLNRIVVVLVFETIIAPQKMIQLTIQSSNRFPAWWRSGAEVPNRQITTANSQGRAQRGFSGRG